jgi:hypothetical protein
LPPCAPIFRKRDCRSGSRTIEKRLDESNAERARQLEQLRGELHVEIRDVKLANAARTDVIARQVQHFEQRFDAAIASPKSKAQAER